MKIGKSVRAMGKGYATILALGMLSLGACSRASHEGEGEVASSGKVKEITIAKCDAKNMVKGAEVVELATVVQRGKEITIDYQYTTKKQEQLEQGSEKIVGRLDPSFRQFRDKDSMMLLLESATLSISAKSSPGFDGKVKKLGKTELSRVGDRLIIEEADIVLDLHGCKFGF